MQSLNKFINKGLIFFKKEEEEREIITEQLLDILKPYNIFNAKLKDKLQWEGTIYSDKYKKSFNIYAFKDKNEKLYIAIFKGKINGSSYIQYEYLEDKNCLKVVDQTFHNNFIDIFKNHENGQTRYKYGDTPFNLGKYSFNVFYENIKKI